MKQTNKTNTTRLVLGAVMLALFVVLYLVVPVGQKAVQSLLIVVTVLPMGIFSCHCGWKPGLLLIAAGAALCFLLMEPLMVVSYSIPALIIGVATGILLRNTRRLTAVLVLTALHVGQNLLEIFLYYRLMELDFFGTYQRIIDQVMERLLPYLTTPVLQQYAQGTLLCCIPAVLLVGAAVKALASYLLLKLLWEKLAPVVGGQPLTEKTAATKLHHKGFSWGYLCFGVPMILWALLSCLGILPYTFALGAVTALYLCCSLGYFYWFYLQFVRPAESQKRLIGSGLLILLLPVNLLALPIYTILKKEA